MQFGLKYFSESSAFQSSLFYVGDPFAFQDPFLPLPCIFTRMPRYNLAIYHLHNIFCK